LSVVHPQAVSRVFGTRRREVLALDGISFDVGSGEFVVVRGPSGSGKTTLLLTLGGMLRPSSGRVLVNGRDIYAAGERARARFRAQNIGFVFQMFHLVPYLTVVENVMLAAGPGGNGATRAEARELLGRLRLLDREHHRPAELSAGERQRTAIARALLNRPKLVLADEPTGNLDPESAAEVIEALAAFHRDGGTVIIVTHGTAADRHANRIIYLRNGRIERSTEIEKEPTGSTAAN
jgi:putative ABC transport system ATP-binding protein